ncbi:hypothetical protein GF323_02480 [Candidatus Woesearchaeota archaeon]|nr:hypothetical protein [Candidatus Woesearchaeota archaeon]
MPEKHIVVDGIRFTYSGMFDISEFFQLLDEWTDGNDYERETKKKLEHVFSHGKRMEYVFELWKPLADYARSTVRIKALFRDIVDFELKKGMHKRNMQKGKVLVIIDGFLETDIEYRWQQKPLYIFLRTLYDKLVWKFWLGRYDGDVSAACSSLYNTLFGYFKRYKY